MTQITTHVLDTSLGHPAANVPVVLDFQTTAGTWTEVARGSTDAHGRCKDLSATKSLQAGTYRLTFDTGAYFSAHKIDSLYPQVTIVFSLKNAEEHYHIPLLLSPYGYSTYRGS
jgi:5-hydroxyisourate hydrolase